jgi:hypothetical protein
VRAAAMKVVVPVSVRIESGPINLSRRLDRRDATPVVAARQGRSAREPWTATR